jgi:surfeit locus 1 family protein
MSISRTRLIGGVMFFGSATILTAGMGMWQLKRHSYKTELLEQRQSQVQSAPLILDEHSDITSETLLDFRRVELTGEFLHDHFMRLGPRTKQSSGATTPSMLSDSSIGYRIIVPFCLASGRTLLVDRGWVPKGSEPDIPRGEQKLVGMLRKSDAQNQFSITNAKADNDVWVRLDAEQMLADAKIPKHRRIPLLLEEGTNFTNRIASKVTPEMHLIYAGTWFTMAGFFLLMTLSWIRKTPTQSKSIVAGMGYSMQQRGSKEEVPENRNRAV